MKPSLPAKDVTAIKRHEQASSLRRGRWARGSLYVAWTDGLEVQVIDTVAACY
jgi:hypothetical protein